MRYSLALRAVLFCLPIICVVAAAHAAEQNVIALRNIPGAPLKTRVPPGYCVVDPAKTEIERVLNARLEATLSKEGSGVLAYFADCASHARLGEILLIDSWIIVAGKITNGTVEPVPGYTRAQVLDGVAAALPMIDANAVTARSSANVEKTFEEFGIGLQVQIKPLGVLGRDSNGLYQGLAQRLVVDGKTVDIVAVFGITYVKNFPVNITLYRQYQSAQTITELLDATKQLVRDFVIVNEGL